MARNPKKPNAKAQTSFTNGYGVLALTKELWQAAVNLRGSIEPADYKRYVLPIIFLRFLSLSGMNVGGPNWNSLLLTLRASTTRTPSP